MPAQSLIGKILGNTKPSAADELRQALEQVKRRESEINSRIAAIQPDNVQTGAPGPERQRALMTGSPAELVELDREMATLQAERDQQLPAQRAELQFRLKAAEADEAAARLPERIRKLPAAIKAHDQAAAALKKARAALDESVSEIIRDRSMAGDHAPAADDATVAAICRIRGFEEDSRPHMFNTNRATLFRQLTGETTAKARGAGISERGRDRFAEDERGDPEHRRRHPESSIWHRREPGEAR